MDRHFVGYKSIERELKDRFRKGEICTYDFEMNMKLLLDFHNKEGESTIFRITKSKNGRINVDYSK